MASLRGASRVGKRHMIILHPCKARGLSLGTRYETGYISAFGSG